MSYISKELPGDDFFLHFINSKHKIKYICIVEVDNYFCIFLEIISKGRGFYLNSCEMCRISLSFPNWIFWIAIFGFNLRRRKEATTGPKHVLQIALLFSYFILRITFSSNFSTKCAAIYLYVDLDSTNFFSCVLSHKSPEGGILWMTKAYILLSYWATNQAAYNSSWYEAPPIPRA